MDSYTFDANHPKTQKLLKNLNNGLKMKAYLWKTLPMAAFSGVRVGQVTPDFAEVVLRYGWRSQNPFRSIYFAAQCAAAELSTGLLVLAAKEAAPSISMLVTDFQASFYKKADDTLTFRCDQGAAIIKTIEQAVQSGEGVTFEAITKGILPSGEIASEMKVLWSFKTKTKR